MATLEELANNDQIHREGLTLVYEVEKTRLEKLDEHFYYTQNPQGTDYRPGTKIEIPVVNKEGKTVFHKLQRRCHFCEISCLRIWRR